MRKHSRRISSGMQSIVISPNPRISGKLPDTTIPPSTDLFKWRDTVAENTTYSLSIFTHISLWAKVELSRKRISLLLEQEIVRVASQGFSLLDYFSFEWMLNYLIGSQSIHKVNGKKMSTVVYCAYLILLQYRENWNLLFKKSDIHPDLKEFVEKNFGSLSDRKYQSRKQIYQLEKFLMLKVEDVMNVIERDKFSNSVRYSSYCKGYGEGGRSVRKQSTRYSFELDRDDHIFEIPEEFYSFGKSIHDQEDLFYIEQQILNSREA